MLPLALYDIPSKLPGNNWSYNPAKPKFVLSYKGLPFENVWVELLDIAPKMKEIGVSPNKVLDGTEHYTLPVLSDLNTGTVIADSWAIAEYLDQTYPQKPIFPNGSKGLISAFNSAMAALGGASFRFVLLRTSEILNGHSLEFFVSAKEAALGDKIDKWFPEGSKCDAHREIIENSSVKLWYDKVDDKWMMGDTFSYADIILASYSLWFKSFSG